MHGRMDGWMDEWMDVELSCILSWVRLSLNGRKVRYDVLLFGTY